jgi:riboflavin transporter FmnP
MSFLDFFFLIWNYKKKKYKYIFDFIIATILDTNLEPKLNFFYLKLISKNI